MLNNLLLLPVNMAIKCQSDDKNQTFCSTLIKKKMRFIVVEAILEVYLMINQRNTLTNV